MLPLLQSEACLAGVLRSSMPAACEKPFVVLQQSQSGGKPHSKKFSAGGLSLDEPQELAGVVREAREHCLKVAVAEVLGDDFT